MPCTSPSQVLEKYWGYAEFRPLQREIIDSVLDGRDTLGLLPTGGGKSITFQVPAMLLPGLTIVVTPLISLMKDQVDNLRQRGIRAYCLHSGMTRAESRLASDRCRLGKSKILYVSPERLQSQAFIDEIRSWQISLVVVDEAHCISQWGYDFRPSYLKIKKLRELFPDAPVLALTASATPEVADDIMLQLEFRPGASKFAKSFSRANISYVVRHDDYKERTLLKVLRAVPGTGIVYVRSRRKCRELASMLEKEGIPASYYHAGLYPEEKEERQNAWKDGTARVMVATNAFGMGIDKPDVRVVAHFDLPSSLEEYYQEAGRAGRDGLPSFAVVIAGRADKGILTRRLNESFPPKDYILHVYEMLGNFLSLAVGAGYDQIFDFNLDKFCVTYGLQPATAYAALKILNHSGYIEYVDEVQQRSRVMIIADKREFYSLSLSPETDSVFTELQRAYTGLFADFTHIDENKLARRAGVSADQVYQSLLELARMKVISYVPKKQTAIVYYKTSREEPRHVAISRAAYEERKERMERRIEAMRQFVFDSENCRVQTMLAYFGETAAEPCGTCDVCRSRKPRPAPTQYERDSAAQRVKALAARPGGIAVEEAIAAIGSPRQLVIDAIRQLADEGAIALAGTRISIP